MDFPALRTRLVDEAARFKAAALAAAPDAPVPTCPEWTATDLLDHVTETYDHKIQSMRLMRAPEDADMPRRAGAPGERFDAALADLLAEFDDRGPDSLAYTWYGPDQTVGFWIRRLAHETVVHRADAELAAGRAIGPVEPAFALDGADEMLQVMVDWGSRAHRRHLAAELEAHAGLTVALAAGDASWTVQVGPAGAAVTAGTEADAQAEVHGTPGELLMWLWRRLPPEALTVKGDAAKAAELYELLGAFAQ
ncbi:maleylpyruvate isomerase family mycothiol-dependent enzyme [Glycomyces sp. A-F 0318]|uniref:maleylpyruvate isomerase family mycothiol-dependent enzyme n=1 Tax=Glycomyces amatae TaxID=2881355 RepID=UPI001E4D604D|nr:maleylpyruvate isomerase family mycothiol-dependent enzyme [Glycomyces amatae]MCD0442803.1 maleylpyruvate isomerase family mycothiol-dependent enzyme [Glycomyces amatae]